MTKLNKITVDIISLTSS